MAKITDIVRRVDKNKESIYLIDDYDERGIFYSPEHRKDVLCKSKGKKKEKLVSRSNPLIIESVFNAREVSEKEYCEY